MFRRIRKGRPAAANPSRAHARRVGAALAWVTATLAPPAWTHAEDRQVRRVVQAEPGHDMSAHSMPQPLPAPRPPTLAPAEAAPAPSAPGLGPNRAPPSSAPGLADFERIALERNPTLRQATAQFDAARSRSFQAGLYPNPTVGYIQEQIGAIGETVPTAAGIMARGRGTPGELVGGFVQQQIVTGGKLRLSRAKFAEEATAARWQAEAQRLRVVNGVRIHYFEVLAAQRLVAIQAVLAALNDDAVRTTEELVNVGQANAPDLLQARVEGRRAKVAQRNAESRHRGSWEQLVSLIGAPELRPVPLDETLLDAPAAPIDLGAVLDEILRCSPEIQAALAEIRRDNITVRRERAEPIPNLTVQAIVGHNYEFGITTAGVQASVPLPVFNRNQGTVREAQSELSRDYAEYDRVVLSIRKRLADTATRYNDALQSVDDFRTETLALAKRAYEVQLANFQQRRAAWPQVLVARRTYVDLNREFVESLLELRRAEVELRGMLLVDGLTPPQTPTSQGHIEAVPTPR